MSSWENHYQEFVVKWCESHGRNPPSKNPRAVLSPQEENANQDGNTKYQTMFPSSPVKKEDSVKVKIPRRQPVREEFVTKTKKAKTVFLKEQKATENKVCSGSPQGRKSAREFEEISFSLQSSNLSISIPAESAEIKPLTYYPTMEEMENFEAYVAYMESQGAHKEGIARIVPPKEWIPRKAGYEPSEMTDIIIKKPVKQEIISTGVAYTVSGDRSLPPLTLPKYASLATNQSYLAPNHKSHEELEELYWNQNQDASHPSPLYAADVEASLTDPDQEIFNIPRLHSLLTGKNLDFFSRH